MGVESGCENEEVARGDSFMVMKLHKTTFKSSEN